MLVKRFAVPVLHELLGTFRLVTVGGARQVGKTTMVVDLLDFPAESRFSFDDPAVLAAATIDPVGFVAALPTPAAIDEFQRAGTDFLLAVKRSVDLDSTRGRLVLTGSTNYRAARGPVETLAGRAGHLTLWPLSIGERVGRQERFLDRTLGGEEPQPTGDGPATERASLGELLLTGGYPEVLTEAFTARQRRAWFSAYVNDVVAREALRPIAELRHEPQLRKLLRLVGARTAQVLVASELARDAELDRHTVTDWLALLEALHLVLLLPAWSTNLTTRVIRRPKVHVTDVGLAADLAAVSEAELRATAGPSIVGALLETFVVTELAKQATWSERTVELAHLRDRNGVEVDVIAEDRRSGGVAGIEVKAAATVTASDARHLSTLRDRLGPRFVQGIVLYSGEHVLPLGDRLWGAPLSALWG